VSILLNFFFLRRGNTSSRNWSAWQAFAAWGLYHKTYYGRNLRISVIS